MIMLKGVDNEKKIHFKENSIYHTHNLFLTILNTTSYNWANITETVFFFKSWHAFSLPAISSLSLLNRDHISDMLQNIKSIQ